MWISCERRLYCMKVSNDVKRLGDWAPSGGIFKIHKKREREDWADKRICSFAAEMRGVEKVKLQEGEGEKKQKMDWVGRVGARSRNKLNGRP